MPDIVVSDVAAVAIAQAIAAQTTANGVINTAQLAALEKLLGTTATNLSPGGLTAQVAKLNYGIEKMVTFLESNAIVQKDMGTAIGSLARSIDVQTKALANIQHTLLQVLNTQQLAVVDQMKANKHHQLVVADSRAAQGKEDIVVKPEDKAAVVQEQIESVIELKKSVLGAGTISSLLTAGAVEGQALALKWYAESGLEKYFTDTWITIKGQATLLYAELKTKEQVVKNAATVAQTKLAPTDPPIP